MHGNEEYVEFHPYRVFLSASPLKLILGSFPPWRFSAWHGTAQLNGERVCGLLSAGDIDFYYGSRDNGFWRIINEVYDRAIAENEQEITLAGIEAFLVSHRFAVADIFKQVVRRGRSAVDEALRVIEYTDIKGILNEWDSINRIYFTSQYVRRHFIRHLRSAPAARYSVKTMGDRNFDLMFEGRLIKCSVLYSPSGNALRGLAQSPGYRREKATDPALSVQQYRLNEYRRIFRG